MDITQLKAWPFEEARRLAARLQGKVPEKGYVLFETGYGPSGLPHIGTFGEVLRATMVRRAFEHITGMPTRLFCFSDDMDGLRKVPDNVPDQDMLRQYIDFPLTKVPDPFGKYESFGHHNNAMLRRFLDSFGFEYEFQSATDWYRGGRFDDILRLVLQNYDEIMRIMLPSLRDERRATYSPFLPVCSRTGRVLQVPMVELHPERDTVVYKDPETGELTQTLITGGHCKLQWKVDWGMRWRAFAVDYEMSGKDLIDSVKLSSRICNAIGGRPPENLTYELFLDDQGQKISKSKGNGLTIDEWLRYAPTESLAYYMYQAPKRAKRLYFDVIPKAVDEYIQHWEKYETRTPEEKLESPLWHIHNGKPESYEQGISFSLLLNLAAVCNTEDPAMLWGFIRRYMPQAIPEQMPFLTGLVKNAIAYYQDFVKPHKRYRDADAQERKALQSLITALEALPEGADAHAIQTEVYETGKACGYTDLRSWFKTLYEILLGQEEGPRIGSFFALYGLPESITLIKESLRRSGAA